MCMQVFWGKGRGTEILSLSLFGVVFVRLFSACSRKRMSGAVMGQGCGVQHAKRLKTNPTFRFVVDARGMPIYLQSSSGSVGKSIEVGVLRYTVAKSSNTPLPTSIFIPGGHPPVPLTVVGEPEGTCKTARVCLLSCI